MKSPVGIATMKNDSFLHPRPFSDHSYTFLNELPVRPVMSAVRPNDVDNADWYADEEVSRIAEKTCRIPAIGLKPRSDFGSHSEASAAHEFAQPSLARFGDTIDGVSTTQLILPRRDHGSFLRTPNRYDEEKSRLSPPLLLPGSVGYGDCLYFSDVCPPLHILLPNDF